jgi:hypothetical protein
LWRTTGGIGIRLTSGIGAVTFGGATDWAKVIEFETALATSNADVGRMSYITSPTVRAKWKALSKIAASTFPIFIWESSARFPNAQGEVNG